ncbi:MAG: dockerin type I domain-containing protein [Candidatus Poribacteria bacterium]|nr:dockerin type I domain-containing protein [Candidatus Poribacteria bacterium]
MRNICAKCAYILVLQFVLITTALANTLTLGEQGEVFAETDRYRVRFKEGMLVHFHNKLTQETYTLPPPQGHSNKGRSGIAMQHEEGDNGKPQAINKAWDIETQRLSPLSVEIAYHYDFILDKTVRFRISIDADTGDLIIQQHGISENVVWITWVCRYLNSQQVDVILPANCGKIIDASTEFSERHFRYPERWEAQLAILQGGDGGFFVRSTDTTFRFKSVYYIRSGEHFGLSFQTDNPAPFRGKNEITSVEWRLNAYRGDWQVPAEIYRNWMETTFQPKQPPAWVKDLELIIYAPYQPLDLSILPLLAEHVNPSTTLLYVIGWYDPNQGLEPDYPPDSEWGDFLEAAHGYGFRVMPRITFHGCSPYSPLYPEFEKYQLRHPTSGHRLGYALNDPTYDYPTAYINPASKAFRKYVVEQMKTLYETYPIDALHLDINTSVVNDANGLIDGLTAAEGNVLLHQELAAAMPGIVLGGENVHEVTFFNTNLAQRWSYTNKQPHPISSFLFSSWTIPYGFHVPNPDWEPERYQQFQEAYIVWDVLPTIRIRAPGMLTNPNMVRTRDFLKSVQMGQSWEQTWNIDVGMDIVGDVNGDGVVNIQDLVIVANAFGKAEPDLNGDGVVNIQDLVIVANAFE